MPDATAILLHMTSAAGVVSTGLFNKVDFRYPFAVLSYVMALTYGQTPLQGAQSDHFCCYCSSAGRQGRQVHRPTVCHQPVPQLCQAATNPRAYDVDARVKVWEQTVRLLKQVTRHDVPNLPSVGTRV